MHSLKSLFFLSLIASAAMAETVTVSPASMAQWHLRDASVDALFLGDKLLLPEGAQLARSFASPLVVARMVSHPALASSSTDWPVIELGPIGVALVRGDSGCILALVVGDELVRQVPIDDGAEMLVGYDAVAGLCLVRTGDQTIWHVAPQGRVADVFLTAGANAPWSIDAFAVEVGDNGVDAVPKDTSGPLGASASTAKSGLRKIAALLKDAPSVPSLRSQTDVSTQSNFSAEAVGKARALEIASPSAFRYGRASVVRTTVAQAAKF